MTEMMTALTTTTVLYDGFSSSSHCIDVSKESPRKKKVLITGSGGFLGSRVHKMLLSNHRLYEVSTFDLSDGQDILDADAVDSAIEKNVDIVIHLAAVSNLNFFTTDALGGWLINMEGTKNVVRSANKHGAIVMFASTCCAYGNNNCHPSYESSPLSPTEPYAQSKADGEKIILNANDRNIVMRLATFYGPGMRGDLAVARFLERAHKGEPLLIHGDGKQTRTLTHVDDVARGIVLLVRNISTCNYNKHLGDDDRIFNITSERSVSVLDLVHLVEKTVKRPVKIRHVADRKGQIFNEQISSRKLKSLGWVEEFTFEDGVQDSYDYFRIHGLWASEGAKGVKNGVAVLA